MDNQLENKIKKALENVKPWQRVPTSLNGVFLVKTPAKGSQETIMVEINPLDERGSPIKRKGIFLRQTNELKRFLEVMENHRLQEVLETLETLSGVSGEEEIGTLEI
jgi:hypothetical protein